MMIRDVSVRCTGHLSAISSRRGRCSSGGTDQLDFAFDVIEHHRLFVAFPAVLGVALGVAQPHDHALQRNLLARGVEAHGHRGAGAQRHQQQFVRAGAGVGTADRGRLVRGELVPSVQHVLGEAAVAGFGDHDRAVGDRRWIEARTAHACTRSWYSGCLPM
jgi:hypothetical protein